MNPLNVPFAPSSTVRSTLFGFALMAAALTLGGIDALAAYTTHADASALMAHLRVPAHG